MDQQNERDWFEIIREEAGCDYISDLHREPYRTEALVIIENLKDCGESEKDMLKRYINISQ